MDEKILNILNDVQDNVIDLSSALSKIKMILTEYPMLPENVKEQISFLQWLFKKIDKGDEPIETVRILNMHREEIENIIC